MSSSSFHMIIHTLCPSLPAPANSFLPSPLHISTDRHPIIPNLTLQVPKPSRSATSHHIIHLQRFCDLVKGRLISVPYIYIYIYISYTLNAQKTVQNLSMLSTHSVHPPRYHTLCSLLSKLCRFIVFIAHVSVPNKIIWVHIQLHIGLNLNLSHQY